MSSTIIQPGDPTAVKLNSVAFFAESMRQGTFRRNLKGPAPKKGGALAKIAETENAAMGMQTSPDFPIVQINDLTKQAGDTVTVDLVHIIGGKPTMGDEVVEGRLQRLTFDDTAIVINQYRHGVDAGGRMTQQRTRWPLGRTAVASLGSWFARFEDELCQIHICGGRGHDYTQDWAIPLESDREFEEIMVNPLTPPTPNRRFYANSATGIADIGSADAWRLEDIDNLRVYLDEMVFPLQPVKLPNDPMVDSEDPLYVLYLTARQWHYMLMESDSRGNDIRRFQQDATTRRMMTKHPLFLGEVGMWRGILVKKMRRAVRYMPGLDAKEYSADGSTINTVQAGSGITVDTGFLLGAQALAEAYGKNAESGYYSDWYEGKRDGNNRRIYIGSMMGGKKKLRFKGSDGTLTDHGVVTVYSYAPEPRSDAGRTLVTSLRS